MRKTGVYPILLCPCLPKYAMGFVATVPQHQYQLEREQQQVDSRHANHKCVVTYGLKHTMT